MDTCDREAITWTATTAGISGEMVRDMMLVAIERRFGNYHAPHRVDFSPITADPNPNFWTDGTREFSAK
jgi:putative transposase